LVEAGGPLASDLWVLTLGGRLPKPVFGQNARLRSMRYENPPGQAGRAAALWMASARRKKSRFRARQRDGFMTSRGRGEKPEGKQRWARYRE